jgi:hypothetical protein
LTPAHSLAHPGIGGTQACQGGFHTGITGPADPLWTKTNRRAPDSMVSQRTDGQGEGGNSNSLVVHNGPVHPQLAGNPLRCTHALADVLKWGIPEERAKATHTTRWRSKGGFR